VKGEILIVDDQPANLDLLIGILEQHGCEVRVATSGRRALAAIAAQPPDLVLLDISMPEMDGYEVCRRMKSDPTTEQIPVIFLSVHDEVVDKVRAFAVGGVDYISKPFHPEEVRVRVETQLSIARLRRELEQRNDELERKAHEVAQASRAKSMFLANMSHELRTPLNGILGFVQLLQRDRTVTAEQREKISIIMRSGEHLLGLLNDVLSISKIESGQVSLNETTFDLRRMLQGLEEIFRLRAENKELQLLVAVSGPVPGNVRGDEGKLRQVLINLLGNAVKFTERGGVALRVKWEDGAAEFEVEDTGEGIREEELARLFEPFVQTESGRKAREGTGLGLAISRDFVTLMGGDISIRSEQGRGTTLRFELPLPGVDEADLPPQRVVVGLEPGQQEYRVLVVDDRYENRLVLSGLLQSVGLHVREAGNGADAVAVWEQWHPHLIWMDMHMPGIDGFEATRRIRAAEAQEEARARKRTRERPVIGGAEFSRTVILGLSASVFESDRRDILAAGCDDFVGKPFREEAIFEKMAEHVGMRLIYGDSLDERPSPHVRPVVPGCLAAMNETWRSAFERALAEGDVSYCGQLADDIADAETNAAVRKMLREYRFDELLDLLGKPEAAG
jgi:signal transduction histidine kinase